MANRYWIGGSGTWNGSSTTHWSASSGGSAGASVPTSSDNVFFDSNSGLTNGTVALATSYAAQCSDFTSSTGVTYTQDHSANNSSLNVYGSVRLEPGMKQIGDETLISVYPHGTPITLDWNGNVGGVGYLNILWSDSTSNSTPVTLLSDMYLTGDFYSESGILNLNGFSWRSIVFEFDAFLDGSDPLVPTAYFTDSTITCKFFDVYTESSSGLRPIIYAGNETITMQNLSGLTATPNIVIWDYVTQVGASGYNFGNVIIADRGRGGFALNFVYGGNTFKSFQVIGTSDGVQWEENMTNTFYNFSAIGSSSDTYTFDCFNGTTNLPSTNTYTMKKIGAGLVLCDGLDIQHSVATPASTWYAGPNSVDNQDTTTKGSGWIFSYSPATQKRDSNGVPCLMGVLNSDGSTATYFKSNQYTNAIKIADGTSGSNNGPTNAKIDVNGVRSLLAVSSSDGTTPVPVYADSNGNLLVTTS